MRHAPIPATLFTTCPTCGDNIAAAIPTTDRTCPRDRGTVTFTLKADTTAFDEALTGRPRPPAAGGTVTLAQWQQQLIAAATTIDARDICIVYPRRAGRSLTLNAIDAAREARRA